MPTILVIEDEQYIADLLRERLDDEGYQVKVAYTGADAILQLKTKSPDVITLDIVLPDANGLTILKDIKSDPATAKIPVIIISSSEENQAAKALGAEDFLSKPINFKKLFDTIKEIKQSKENKTKNDPSNLKKTA